MLLFELALQGLQVLTKEMCCMVLGRFCRDCLCIPGAQCLPDCGQLLSNVKQGHRVVDGGTIMPCLLACSTRQSVPGLL